MRIAEVLRGSVEVLRRSWLPLLGGLALIATAVFIGTLFYLGLLFYAVTEAVVVVEDWILIAFGILMPVVLLLSLAAVLVFAAGLPHMLVQRAKGRGGALGYAFAAFRRVGWLAPGALAAALGFLTLGFPWLLIGIVVFAVFVYVAPLILDARLPGHRAVARSVELAGAYGILSHYALMALGALLGAAGWAASRLILGSVMGEDWLTTDVASWDIETRSVAGLALTYDSLFLALGLAWSITVTIGVFAVLTAAMYRTVTRMEVARSVALGAADPALAPAPPPPPAAALGPTAERAPRARWPLAGAIAVLAIMGCSTWFVWWIASPTYDPLGDHMVAPGAVVSMRNGMTLTVPEYSRSQEPTGYYTYRRYPDWLKVGENTSAWDDDHVGWRRSDEFTYQGLQLWIFSFSSDRSSWLARWTRPEIPVVLRSPDGTVEARWKKGMNSVVVTTRLPGHDPGWLRAMDEDEFADPDEVRGYLGALWRELRIQGAQTPTEAVSSPGT